MAAAALDPVLRHIRKLADAGPGPADPELLERFVQRCEEAAFEALVRRHGPTVLGVGRRVLHDRDAADDVFQATFLILARHAHRLGRRGSLGGWLYTVAYRLALKAKADAQRRRQPLAGAARAPAPDPLAELTARELCCMLDEELQRLPEKHRLPLLLCCVEGKAREEAARQLGWTPGQVKAGLERGRKTLLRRLERRGVTLSAALLAAGLTQQTATAALAGLLKPTLQAALLVAAGQSVSEAASPSVAALVESGIRATTTAKLKIATALLLTATVLGGVGFAVGQRPAEEPVARAAEPKAQGREPKADLYGDPLPAGALARMGTVRFRNGNLIGSVTFSPDGKLLASGGYCGTVRLHDPATGKEVRTIETLASQFPSIAFSPDGKTLATTGYKLIQLWETATGKELRRFAAEVSDDYAFQFVLPVVFSPDGKALASVDKDHSVRLWDVKTGKELQKLIGDERRVRCLAFSADGKVLFSATGDGVQGGSVHSWDTGTGKEVRKFALSAGGQLGSPLGFSADRKTLAFQAHEILVRKNVPRADVLDWQVVSLLDVTTGEVRLKLEPERGRFKSAAFSPDGKLVATVNGEVRVTSSMQSQDLNRVRVWDAATGKLLFDFPGYSEYHGFKGPGILAFSPDGKLLAAAGSGSALHVWDLTRGREHLEKPEAHHHEIWTVAFSPDGRTLASGSSDHAIIIWDAATGKQLGRLRGHESTVAALAYSPDGKLLASASRWNEQTVRLWDLASGKELRRYVLPWLDNGDGTSVGVNTWVAFASGGKVLAASGTDRKLRLWDVATGKELLDQTVRRRASYLIPEQQSTGPYWHSVNDVAFTADGRTVALATDKAIYVVDVATGQALYQFETSGGAGYLAFSPTGGTLLCSIGGNRGRLVEIASGKDLHAMELSDSILATAFSPSGRHVAVATGRTSGTVYVFDVRTGKEVHRFQSHAYVRCLAFSPDGTKLVSGHLDTSALVWDLTPALAPVKTPAADLGPQEFDKLWTDLRDADAPKAHAAVWAMIGVPEKAVSLLESRIEPVARIQPERLRQLVADLDVEDFATRDKASKELAKLGIEAEPALRKALEGEPTLEMRRRLTALLNGPAPQTEMTPDSLRHLRAVQVLEQIGNTRARQVLTKLADGASSAPLTRGAKAALERLDKRPAAP